MCIYTEWLLAIGLWAAGFVLGVLSQKNCDVTISTLTGAPPNGSFESPGFPAQYPDDVHCLYKFVGQQDQRVRIRFNSFALQGRYPECEHDYVDVFAQLEHESDDLLDALLTGRFCGESMDNLPNLIVSTSNVLILSFYTNGARTNRGFQGTYEFINANIYIIGTEAPPRMCGYTVRRESKKSGYIVSPTYPGMYPNNLFCFYKLQGKPGERIRLRFEEFILFHGGEYCPFDYVKIYDGHTNAAPLIGTFCGRYNASTILFSTAEALHLEFVTGQGRLEFSKPIMEQEADFSFDRRGFNITYEFSDKWVDLRFITEEAKHVIGTECDQRILSTKESNGTIFSPGYPSHFPQGIVCRYYLDGLMDRQNLEQVKIIFTDFNIPGNMPYCTIGYVGQQDDSFTGRDEVKEKFCGTYRPPDLTSNGPRMVLVLNTHAAVRGGLFVARYKFIPYFAIPGTTITEGQCKFFYDSGNTASKEGTFFSPRYPARYPQGTNCEYILRPKYPEEVLLFHFDEFLLPAREADDIDCLRSDYVAIYEGIGRENKFTLTEKYCGGGFFPGPYATSNEVKVIFHSTEKESNSVGFRVAFRFVNVTVLRQRCMPLIISGLEAGDVIKSPSHPRKYVPMTVCEWTITASRSFHNILLEMPDVNIEGVFQQKCQNAILKVYNDKTSYQPVASICGKPGNDQVFMSVQDSLILRFISSPASVGAKGFKLSWTEIHKRENCPGFQCEKNKYCIAESLKCNDLPNCGLDDKSDETAECMYGPTRGGFEILHIAIGTSISSFFCIILLICGFYHRRKFRSERAPPDHDHVEVRYVSAPTGCNTTDRLLMEEHNDQNNARVTDSPRCQKVSMV